MASRATRQIARGATTKHIPVVIVSTKDQATDRVWGKRQGACDYLTKPVDENQLIDVIKQHLNAWIGSDGSKWIYRITRLAKRGKQPHVSKRK